MANDRLKITIADNASPWLNWAMDSFPNWRRKAMKSLGYFISTKIKDGIRSGAPGGKEYERFMPAARRKKIRREKKNKYPYMGKLVRAVGYQYKDSEGSVVVGWLSNSAIRLGSKHEGGTHVAVTPKMRRKFAAAGVPFSAGKEALRIPIRPTIGPMADVLKDDYAPYIEKKILGYLNTGGPSSSSARRKYTVKGAF